MPRAGLTPQTVVQTAAALVDREGPASLTIARVADQLGVKPPSLYNHIDGLEALARDIALDGIDQLADACRSVVMGLGGGEGLRAMAHAYRAFASAHPGVYLLTQRARPRDPDYDAKAARLLEPLFAILSGYGLTGIRTVHAARTIRSALHGFIMLENQSGFGLDVDVDQSFEWMLAVIERGLAGVEHPATA